MRASAATNLFLLALLAAPAGGSAAAPLHERVDAAIDAQAREQGLPEAPPGDNAEFLRRAYLDLTGAIPTSEQARAFLTDTSADKRAKLIDELLSDERFPRRMAQALSVMLMERRLAPDKPECEQFEGYLAGAIAGDKPFDRIVAEILNPDPENEKTRSAAIFLSKRLENYGQNPVDLPGLTRDVGRMFLGVDLQCAQCHNHLTVREYKQSDYQGLFAFVGHTYLRRDLPFPAVGEKLVDGKSEFVSVFGAGEKRQIGPRLPGGEEVEVPKFEKGQEYLKPPDRKKDFQGVPKFSPLKVLAEQLPRAENERFRRNVANRLWFLMAGRGVVHPLDLHHKDNPPSNPALLEALADGLVEMKFDTRSFLREIALSKAYQRSSRLSDGDEGKESLPPGSFRVAHLKRMSPEQLLVASLTATGEFEAVTRRSKGKRPDDPVAKGEPDPEAEGESAKVTPKKADAPPTMTELRKKFVASFAAPPGEAEVDFNPTVASALFVLNDATILGWLRPREGNLVDRLASLDDAAKVAEELYLSILTRMPSDEERADVADYLNERSGHDPGARAAAIGELAWSLLASTEFAVNH
jgi:Protein of unknown function (DUF1549)/Protein of unknown function (DUF1553)